MMAPANESQSKSNGTTATALRPPEQGLKCPRCDSPNTKFCYYNNYSLAQPRHFCKTCRRYWTKGGALRNVPIGGGCRKSKKSKSSTASSCSSSSSSSLSSLCLPSDPTDSISAIAENCAAIKFLDGMDFQLGMLPFSRLYSSTPSGVFNGGHLVSFGDFSSPTALSSLVGSSATSMVGLNYPTSAAGVYRDVGGSSSTMNSNTHSSIASSIESLSSINQDLHWKLQQQRLAMLFGGENHNESSVTALPTPLLENLQESVSMQLQESSKTEVCVSSRPNKGSVGEAYETTAWFRESAYTSATTSTTNNINNNISGSGNTGNWNGIQTWNDMHQFTALP